MDTKQPWEIFIDLYANLRNAGHDMDTCGKLAWAEAMNAYLREEAKEE